MSRIFIWSVRGMHCASCERTITSILNELPGVEEIEVSLSQKRAGVRLADGASHPDVAALNERLASFGYTFVDQATSARGEGVVCDIGPNSRSFVERFMQGIGMMLLVTALGWLVLRPLRAVLPQFSAQTSLLALFGFGFVASVSTCLASTGAFLLAYGSQQASRTRLIWLHLGRLLAFVLGGVLLGAVGSALPNLRHGSGIITLILGVGFLWVGLNFLELLPSLSSFGVRLPARFNAFADRVTRSSSPIAPFLVGAVTFLLPCGFTQTAQALALASGSAWKGGLMMGLFALGTLPVLAGISTFGSLATLRQRSLRLATGALLVLFAFGQIDGGLTVLGSSVTVSGALSQARIELTHALLPLPAQAREQVIDMTVAYGAFTPNRFTLKQGVPVRWRVNGVDISGCASSIVAPKIGLAKDLHLGLNEISFTPNQPGVIPFSCSMGMIRGSFVVVR